MTISLMRRNFFHYDFFRSETARKLGIDNNCFDIVILENLSIVADKIQQVRDLLNLPIIITSAYRCLILNRAIGSKDDSQHLKGQAVDFICPQYGDPEKIVRKIMEAGIEVDQCLVEKSGSKTWVHLSIKKSANRGEFGRLINGVFERIY